MNKFWLLVGVVLMVTALVGCGGGGGSSKLVPNSSPVPRETKAHLIATTRVARSMFIVAGIGKHVTRAARTNRSLRFQRLLAILHPRRAATAEFDADLGLYQNFIVNDDGSGHQDLFTDQAHLKPAGNFTWGAPQWYNGRPDTYPARIDTVYKITGGNLIGNEGTMSAILQDPDFNNGTIHLTFKNAQGELGLADFTILNGKLSSKQTITLADLVIIKAEQHEEENDTQECNFYFPDDSQITLTINPEGPDQEIYTDPSGTTISTGTIDEEGTGTFQYDDGTYETVDVDTDYTDYDDSSDDSSGDGNDNGDDRKARARTGRRAIRQGNGQRLQLPVRKRR